MRHDDEPVGHGQGLILVVSDHHGGDAESTLELTDLDADFLPELAVEVRQGLVQEQHLGGDDDRPRQGDALLLASRELAWQTVGEVLEPDQSEGLGDPAAALGRCHPTRLQPEGDVLDGRQVWKERVALKDHAGVATVGGEPGDVPSPQDDSPGRGLDEPGDHAERCRLAATAGPEQDDQLGLLDDEVEVPNGDEAPVALGEGVELEPGHVRAT